MNVLNADINGKKMSKFKIQSKKIDNSHPKIKISIREWVYREIKSTCMLDVYGGNGLMFDSVWSNKNIDYNYSNGDSIQYLNRNKMYFDLYDIDPYASPFEAIEIICNKSTNNYIGIVCTDGCLRRVAMMRTKIPKFIQRKTGWEERNLALMAAIYNQYPSYLRYLLKCIIGKYKVKKKAVKYGQGTWKQATCYFAAVLEV